MNFHGGMVEKDLPCCNIYLCWLLPFSDVVNRRSQIGSVHICLCISLHKFFASAKRIWSQDWSQDYGVTTWINSKQETQWESDKRERSINKYYALFEKEQAAEADLNDYEINRSEWYSGLLIDWWIDCLLADVEVFRPCGFSSWSQRFCVFSSGYWSFELRQRFV